VTDEQAGADDPRVIPVSKDEEQWPGLLEVGSEIIARGGLVVLPTDTVYGLGCDPFNHSAVDALFRAKRRGRDLPLPVLVHTWRQAIGLVDEVTDQAQALIAAWWPGPLTLVLREAPGIGWDLGDSRGTVAVRMPKQSFALALIQRTGPWPSPAPTAPASRPRRRSRPWSSSWATTSGCSSTPARPPTGRPPASSTSPASGRGCCARAPSPPTSWNECLEEPFDDAS
jgi:tRNA threonylcarbamoyl adenosine modification protein (Sua5/YciO/YrdC/YwlC family)